MFAIFTLRNVVVGGAVVLAAWKMYKQYKEQRSTPTHACDVPPPPPPPPSPDILIEMTVAEICKKFPARTAAMSYDDIAGIARTVVIDGGKFFDAVELDGIRLFIDDDLRLKAVKVDDADKMIEDVSSSLDDDAIFASIAIMVTMNMVQ